MRLEEAIGRSLIVIPSRNGGALLSRLLPALKVPPRIVTVIDEESTDDTAAVCRAAGVGLVGLGRPHTFAQACNIGADLARKRNCDFVFTVRNDIVPVTDVVRELLGEMLADPSLGAVAPSAAAAHEGARSGTIAYRARWNLANLSFERDLVAPDAKTKRLEADYCELAFAAIRMSAIGAIGFLDSDYVACVADADFGFRLRQAGYSCAYLPQSRIERTAATSPEALTDRGKSTLLWRSKRRFAEKHLGNSVTYLPSAFDRATSWGVVDDYLRRELLRFGLINGGSPHLIFSHPGTQPFDYLYTVWETSALPPRWLAFKDAYRMTMAPSRWVADVFVQSGFRNVRYVPLGVESDVFHPWGPVRRFHDERTFLWFARNQHRKGLDVMLGAWEVFSRSRHDARLIVMGQGVLAAMPRKPDATHRSQTFLLGEYREERVAVHELTTPVDAESLAAVYRGVDFTLATSRSEGFGFVVAESMACGTPAIFGNFGGTKDFHFDGAQSFGGRRCPADYSDKGFGTIGEWWEPEAGELVALLHQAYDMSASGRDALGAAGARLVRQRFSWRATCFALRAALRAVEPPQALRAQHPPAPGAATCAATGKTKPASGDGADGRRFGRNLLRRMTERLRFGPSAEKSARARALELLEKHLGRDGTEALYDRPYGSLGRTALRAIVASAFWRDVILPLEAGSSLPGLFDPRFYREEYPGVTGPPLRHYVLFGAREGKDPHVFFSTNWYLAQYPDAAASGFNPLFHFANWGRKEGRRTQPWCSADWYEAHGT
jgi:glycosyltransferase involved in cell wall biosynthesis